jgi:hypothetical protein
MGDFLDHVFKALEHLADAHAQSRAAQMEEQRRPRRRVRVKPKTSGAGAGDAQRFDAADSSCCVTSRRTIKLEE